MLWNGLRTWKDWGVFKVCLHSIIEALCHFRWAFWDMRFLKLRWREGKLTNSLRFYSDVTIKWEYFIWLIWQDLTHCFAFSDQHYPKWSGWSCPWFTHFESWILVGTTDSSHVAMSEQIIFSMRSGLMLLTDSCSVKIKARKAFIWIQLWRHIPIITQLSVQRNTTLRSGKELHFWELFRNRPNLNQCPSDIT